VPTFWRSKWKSPSTSASATTLADVRSCYPLPATYGDRHAAPLLCAGLIGYRVLRMAGGRRLGIYGFGAAAHIVAQVAKHQGRDGSRSCARRTKWRGNSRSTPASRGRDGRIRRRPSSATAPSSLRPSAH
jgi:propanol-preferring alcohol dehydrogenase